jgi:dTDP-4-amino-4,6-dideoxy-D-galactose acyltransferase
MVETVSACPLLRLEWDSNHFGFDVARIPSDIADADLHVALSEARRGGYRLVYWATNAERGAPPWLLSEFDGRLVDRKVTFARQLPATHRDTTRNGNLICERFTGLQCSDELVGLAIDAGVYSRFALDARVPVESFRRLYRIWIERSVSGEIAGAVLVAKNRETKSDTPLAGMVTVKVENGVGNIGLIAVAKASRRRGIGPTLIESAEQWMIEHGAHKATVVTQAANAPACRLYQRVGYEVEQAENYYHFWPQE